MDPRIADLRRRVARDGAASLDDIDEIDDMLDAEGPCVELLILRGASVEAPRSIWGTGRLIC